MRVLPPDLSRISPLNTNISESEFQQINVHGDMDSLLQRELGIPCNFFLFSQIRYKRKYESVHAAGEIRAGQTGALVVKLCEFRPHSS